MTDRDSILDIDKDSILDIDDVGELYKVVLFGDQNDQRLALRRLNELEEAVDGENLGTLRVAKAAALFDLVRPLEAIDIYRREIVEGDLNRRSNALDLCAADLLATENIAVHEVAISLLTANAAPHSSAALLFRLVTRLGIHRFKEEPEAIEVLKVFADSVDKSEINTIEQFASYYEKFLHDRKLIYKLEPNGERPAADDLATEYWRKELAEMGPSPFPEGWLDEVHDDVGDEGE